MASIVPLSLSSGQHDGLGGLPLKEGETLYIKWPSGHIQEIVVALERVFLGRLDSHGRAVSIECLKAYARLPVFGAVARIYLVGFEAQRSV